MINFPAVLRNITLLSVFLSATDVFAQSVSAEDFFRTNTVEDVRLSPDGKHLAMLYPEKDNVFLHIVNVASGEVVASFSTRSRIGVAEFHWATAERLLIATSRFLGGLDEPMLTG